ncbi:MAG: hypothetical protein ACE5Q6_26915 [Dehalococcoidia bacterium]
MPLRSVNREQAWLLPPNTDELLAADHPVRFVFAFVEGLNRGEWTGWALIWRAQARVLRLTIPGSCCPSGSMAS